MSGSGENRQIEVEALEADHQDGPDLKKQRIDVEVKDEVLSSAVEEQRQCADGLTKPNHSEEEASLKSKEFTSEIYKIELLNVSRNCGYNELKKLVNNKLRLNGHKFKLTSGSHPQVFVNFKNEADKNKALAVLDGYSFRGQVMKTKHAEAAPDPIIQRQQQQESHNGPKTKSDGTDGSPPQSIEELVIEATIPWACHAYADQVKKKQGEVLKVMKQITREIYRANVEIDPHVKRLKDPKANYDTLICDMDEILESPVIDEYRNKSEFTIGINPDTGFPTVGFRVGNYNEGSLSVGPINNLRHLPSLMIKGALLFQSFVQKSSHLPYDPFSHKGVWKQLTVRTTEAEELMLYVLISAEELNTEEVDRISGDLKAYFQGFEHEGLKITSFYLKVAEKHGVSEKNQPSLVYGKPTITEDLFGLKFRISPDAFFQVNTKTTEIMYSAISSMAQLDNETTLLDVCCGTGTIGLSCLKLGTVGEVLGVDWTPAAILDAKLNANVNGLEDKCKFFCGKAEDLLSILIGKAQFLRVVAIVDPPRSGLHASVIHTLRNSKRINTIIYVACNAKSAMQNFIDLAKPISKRFRGEPFRPIRALPVDMFPHTPHFELILVMQRMVAEETQKS